MLYLRQFSEHVPYILNSFSVVSNSNSFNLKSLAVSPKQKIMSKYANFVQYVTQKTKVWLLQVCYLPLFAQQKHRHLLYLYTNQLAIKSKITKIIFARELSIVAYVYKFLLNNLNPSSNSNVRVGIRISKISPGTDFANATINPNFGTTKITFPNIFSCPINSSSSASFASPLVRNSSFLFSTFSQLSGALLFFGQVLKVTTSFLIYCGDRKINIMSRMYRRLHRTGLNKKRFIFSKQIRIRSYGYYQ